MCVCFAPTNSRFLGVYFFFIEGFSICISTMSWGHKNTSDIANNISSINVLVHHSRHVRVVYVYIHPSIYPSSYRMISSHHNKQNFFIITRKQKYQQSLVVISSPFNQKPKNCLRSLNSESFEQPSSFIASPKGG